MNNRFSSTRDLTMVNRCPGIGVPHTNVPPTEAELRLAAKAKRQRKQAKPKPAQRHAIDWPPGFKSAIRVDKHGRMV